jgi:hypothetical protein
MTIRTLATALALTAGLALAVPGDVEAGHRHSRRCGHGYYSSGYRYRPAYDRGYYDRGYYDRGYYSRHDYGYYDHGPRVGYRYRRVWYPRPRVYAHYHGPRLCRRSHVSLHIGF